MIKFATLIVVMFITICGFSFNENAHIEIINRHSKLMAEALKSESVKDLISLFNESSFLLPEYHTSLQGEMNIQEYYTQFFNITQTSNYKKEPFEIIALDGYYAELGTFEHLYHTPSGSAFEYIGKYTTYWQIDANDKPKIIAHIWGSSSYVEAEDLNFVSIQTAGNEAIVPSTHWEKDIEEMRKFAYKAVFSGDARTQMETYADDATYMTYYDPPFIGKEAIAEYFNAHYNPDIPMDSLMTKSVHVIEMGEHALKFGEYYVEWIWEGQPQYVEGKGLTLFKKMGDGTIKIYRQMINHSMPPSPKK